jgi:hypothetical protein
MDGGRLDRLGFNFGYSFDLLKIQGSYDVVVDSGTFNERVFHSEGNTGPLASIDVFDSTFALKLSSQQVQFLVTPRKSSPVSFGRGYLSLRAG